MFSVLLSYVLLFSCHLSLLLPSLSSFSLSSILSSPDFIPPADVSRLTAPTTARHCHTDRAPNRINGTILRAVDTGLTNVRPPYFMCFVAKHADLCRVATAGSFVLLHPPLTSAGVSMRIESGCQQICAAAAVEGARARHNRRGRRDAPDLRGVRREPPSAKPPHAVPVWSRVLMQCWFLWRSSSRIAVRTKELRRRNVGRVDRVDRLSSAATHRRVPGGAAIKPLTCCREDSAWPSPLLPVGRVTPRTGSVCSTRACPHCHRRSGRALLA